MATAMRDDIADAMYRVNEQRPTIYLRDCLGGLRAEVRLREGVITAHRT